MAILKVHCPKTKHIMGLGMNLLKEADVRISFAQQPAPTVD
jgi:hypothetical protein